MTDAGLIFNIMDINFLEIEECPSMIKLVVCIN